MGGSRLQRAALDPHAGGGALRGDGGTARARGGCPGVLPSAAGGLSVFSPGPESSGLDTANGRPWRSRSSRVAGHLLGSPIWTPTHVASWHPIGRPRGHGRRSFLSSVTV